MIGLLLPLRILLDAGGAAPTFHAAPEERYMFVALEPRAFAVAEARAMSVEVEARAVGIEQELRGLFVAAERRRLS